MKITSLLAALLLVSSFATQAMAHPRAHKTHRAHVSLYRGFPIARSHFYNSYASGPNDLAGGSAGGEMSNGRSASEFGGGAP
jgi:hypothetical protein